MDTNFESPLGSPTMIKITNKEIKTNRLNLRHFNKEDLETYSAIMDDNQIARWFPKGDSYTHEESEKSLNNILSHWMKYGFGLWAITKKENDQIIGRCGLNYILESSEVELDFIISKNYWNQGYATEASEAVIFYGFKILYLDKIIALSKPENIASRKVIEKTGLKYIGNVEYWNIPCVKYEILRTDYIQNSLI